MKILKWNIDKEKGSFGCKINKACPNKVISYETLYGAKITVKSSEVRKQPRYEVKFGCVIDKTDLA